MSQQQQQQPDGGDGAPGPSSSAGGASSSSSAVVAAAGGASSSAANQQQPPRGIASLLDAMSLAGARSSGGGRKGTKEKYAFWETQPVMQFSDGADGAGQDGPIDEPKTVQDVRQEPYPLPESFTWCECDINNPGEVQEVYELLHRNYVEDDDAMFRFNYSPEFLAWALQPPGHRRDWHVGVRVRGSGKLVAFISAIPASILANGRQIRAVEINFLCVLKKLRSKRLAPVLIKEITRRVNQQDIWQAAYTAGVVLPKPVTSCRYWHRSLNPKKLIEVGFSSLQPRMTMARTIKLYRLPAAPATPGLRPMAPSDVPAVTELLNSYLRGFKLTQHFSQDEVAHWLLPRPQVVETYVVDTRSAQQQQPPQQQQLDAGEQANGAAGGSGSGSSGIVSMFSFYSLPSSVLGHEEHKELRAAYMYYTVPGPTPLLALMGDALTVAAAKGYDVFNALDLLQNGSILKELKFGIGDGSLQYYLYNWRLANAPLAPHELGLILL